MKSVPYELGHHVLVVDDDRNLRKIISTNLELAGYKVATASDGREALTKIEQEIPDLLLLDLMMPHMDGYEVARRVRSHPNPPIANVPFIILKAIGES
jgi:CheY-like chemotaxis protein